MLLPPIVDIVLEYASEIEFLPWIDADMIHWGRLSKNPAAIDLLRTNPDKIEWWWLSMNPAAIDLLRENPSKIHWEPFSENPGIVRMKSMEDARQLMIAI